jgi:F-type H+-transporting ATPase subunit b
MPQLQLVNFAPQIVWLAIVFVVLYLLMSRIALPKVGDVIDTRARKLDGDLGQAAELRARAEATRKSYETALAQARTQAQSSVAELQANLARVAAERQAALAQRLTAEGKAAEGRIAEAKQVAMGGLRQTAAELAVAAALKLTGAAPAPEQVVRAVDAALGRR